MYDISLYGHLTRDIIFEDFERKDSIGSIANVWSTLVKIDPSLKINLQPTSIGQALIYIDKSTSTRVSKPELNLKTNTPCIKDSKWNHILYVNNLPDTSFIKDINTGVISYDISVGKPIDVHLLKYVDYLFISDEDMFTDFDSLCNLTKGWVILHHKTGSISSNKKEKIVINTQEINDVNVLGAGDMYISYFIVNMLKNIQIKKSLKMSHDDTYKRLLERKNEKI
jgi:hypothetical protein